MMHPKKLETGLDPNLALGPLSGSGVQLSRREFVAAGAAAIAAGGCARTAPAILSTRSPNSALTFAAIGCGNMGKDDIAGTIEAGARLVAMCDVDRDYVGWVFASYPDVPKYADFRVMLERERDIDAVIIATPDHTHAVAAAAALDLGCAVRVQKPMARTIAETRMLRRRARERGVVTAMGNQGHASDDLRQGCEMIWDGAIGEVREVHCWTDRPIWPQGMAAPLPAQPVPETLDWDLWLGPAAKRPYNEGYLPWKWRGWWDFGCGALGDMGCHIVDAPFWALHLSYPDTVACLFEEGNTLESGPLSSVIHYTFPARSVDGKRLPPVDLYWYDGSAHPPRPAALPEDVQIGEGGNGTLFIGSDGFMTCGGWGDNPKLLPEEADRAYDRPSPTLPRIKGRDSLKTYVEFVEACKSGRQPLSSFEYSAPLTEVVLMGNIAVRTRERLEWDAAKGCFRNSERGNALMAQAYRNGWQ